MENHRTNQPRVDIVILNCNSGKSLQETVSSLLENTDYSNYRIIVVDNGSVDNSTAFVEDYGSILLIENNENLGCPGGLNQATPHLDSKYAAFLNDDLVFKSPSWLAAMVSEMEKDDKIGATGFKLYKYYQPNVAEMCTTYLNRFTAYAGYVVKHDLKVALDTHDVPYIGLGAILLRTDLLRKVKFEDLYFLYYDDVEFSLKLWFMGYKIKLVPSAWAFHKHQTAVKRNLTELRMRYLIERNSLLTFLVYADRSEILAYLPTVIVYRIIFVASMLLKCKKASAFGQILAACGLTFHYRWVRTQRRRLQSLRKANLTYTDVSKKSLYDPIMEEGNLFKIMKRIMRRPRP
jgi:GT2 family glycosyltransferase